MNKTITKVPTNRGWILATTSLLLAAAAFWSTRAPAQDQAAEPRTQAELETLVGPIALYPDEVLAVVLPASTYPLQVVEAARFLEDRAADASLEPSDEWDDSIVALLNYPDVLQLMNDDLDWTWDLGQAVLDDEAGVLDAIQGFRERAYDAGNLVSDDRQVITEQDDGVIEIAPADPEVVYIPYYEPASVVVYQPYPVFHYYPYAYPLYYYPYPLGYHFSTGFFWGVTSAFTIGWDSHLIHLHPYTHYLHPYYRRTYYTPYYYRRGINVTVNVNNYRNVWRPRRDRGARPYDGVRAVREGDRAGRTYDGRRYRYSESSGSGGAYRTGDRSRTQAGQAGDSGRTAPRTGRTTARTGSADPRRERSATTNRSTVRTDRTGRSGQVAGNRAIGGQASPATRSGSNNRGGNRISPATPDRGAMRDRIANGLADRSANGNANGRGANRGARNGAASGNQTNRPLPRSSAGTATGRVRPYAGQSSQTGTSARARPTPNGSRQAPTSGTIRSGSGSVSRRAPANGAAARPAPPSGSTSRFGGVAPSRPTQTRPTQTRPTQTRPAQSRASRPQPAASAASAPPARSTDSAPARSAPARSKPTRSAPTGGQRFGSGRGRAPAGQSGRGGRGRQP